MAYDEKWLTGPNTVFAAGSTWLPGICTHAPFSRVWSRSILCETPVGSRSGSYERLSVTGVANTVPLGPNSNALPGNTGEPEGIVDAAVGAMLICVVVPSAPVGT